MSSLLFKIAISTLLVCIPTLIGSSMFSNKKPNINNCAADYIGIAATFAFIVAIFLLVVSSLIGLWR